MSNTPEELKYTKDHEWVMSNEEGVVTVGITDFAQQELGELVYVEVETVGETIQQGEVFGTIEAVKTTSDLFMPISGEIIEFNPNLDESAGDDPTLINSDPYGEGWIVKIKASENASDEKLLSFEEYKELIDS